MDPSSDEVIVREAYAAQYGDPIAFRRGDTVQVQRADAEFSEWLWCRGPDGKEGWVHRSFLSQSSVRAVAIADYSAKELTVAVGERGRVIRVLDGWAFVELGGGRVGWVPERVLNILKI
jgi:SH3-like domain-containing protein